VEEIFLPERIDMGILAWARSVDQKIHQRRGAKPQTAIGKGLG
jgi:hypothetical protein